MNLDGKVILIAGGTGGLGQAVTSAFLQAGATVVLAYHQSPPERAERLVPVAADLTRTDSVARMVTQALSSAGRIDALINLVGGYAGGKVADTTDDTWNRMVSLNLTSAFVISRAVLPHMTARGSGRIVHVASRAAERPFPGAAAYIVSKAGLLALTRVLAIELQSSGVTVNAVLPTIIDTPANRREMPDADRSAWVAPADLAHVLMFLASDQAAEINGALIPVG